MNHLVNILTRVVQNILVRLITRKAFQYKPRKNDTDILEKHASDR